MAILFTSLFCVAFRVEKVQASGTIYISADGSVVPDTAPISTVDNVTYILTSNINDSIVVERNNIVVDGAGYMAQGTGSEVGIDLSDRNNVTIQNIAIKKFLAGIGLLRSSNNTITGNYLTANNNHGIYLGSSSNYNSLFRNNITNNPYGIVLVDSHSNSISENNITNNGYGEYISWSSKNIVTANSVAKNKRGVSLSNSPDNVLRDNSIDNNDYNFDVSASHFPTSAFINDVDESNTVNGKPIYYWVNRQNDKIPADAGYIALVNSENIAVEDLNLTHNVQGILIAYSTNITIQNNLITENSNGIHLAWSTNNHIVQNDITANTMVGVYLWPLSSNNIIARNIIANNWRGIGLTGSSNNAIIYGNNITNNDYGINLFDCDGNTIYHNNFINNTNYQASVGMSSYNNIWDNGYPSGGNYWSDYNGTDTNHDGIGDSNYTINADNNDRYPLMGMFSSFNTSLGKYTNIISNSTIEDFTYFESNSTIRMHVSNMTGNQTHGFVRITIPHALMTEPYNITVDGVNPTYWNYTLHDNGTHRWIYFAYEHSTLEIIIVPEFPSLIILPLVMVVSLLTALACKGRKRKARLYN